MIAVTTEIIYALCIIINFTKIILDKVRSKSHFLNIIIFILIGFVMAHTRDDFWDMLEYAKRYEELANQGMKGSSLLDIGFDGMMVLASNIGLNFDAFKTILVNIGLIVILISLSRLGANIGIWCTQFLFYFIFLEGLQIRNFVAMTFTILGISFLVKGTKNSKISFALCIIIGSLFHKIVLLYLLFLFADKVNGRKVITFSSILTALVALLISRSGIRNSIVNIAGSLNSELGIKMTKYTSANVHLGALFPIVIFALYVLLMTYIANNCKYNEIIKTSKLNGATLTLFSEEIDYNSILVGINYLGFLFFPLLFIDLVFYRTLRNICLIDSFFIASTYRSLHQYARWKVIISMILLTGLWMIFDFCIYNHWSNFYQLFFTNYGFSFW